MDLIKEYDKYKRTLIIFYNALKLYFKIFWAFK